MVIRRFLLSLFIEFGPVAIFFFGAKYWDFFVGVALLIVSTIFALVLSLIRDKRVPIFSLIASAFVLIFGTLTLIFKDPVWVVFEYTLYNGLFGVVLFIGAWFQKPYLKNLFEGMFAIEDKGWLILSWRWGLFFILIAVSNEIVWRFYGEDIWLDYRLVASAALAVFGFSQFYIGKRHRLPEASEWGLRKK